jgi:spermidine synthase
MVFAILVSLFFLSGASALLFQTVWFRLVGLSFGNGVWASSLVLASFMGGLAVGNALASRRRDVPGRALRLYAALELGIGLGGFAVTLVLPRLPGAIAPALGGLLEAPLLLNAVRLGVCFALLLVPTSAMGATLPVLVAALSSRSGGFGPALGRLYGWNTLGAVAGALGGELFLVGRLGLVGTGAAAAAANILAAVGASLVARGFPEAPGALPAPQEVAAGPRGAAGPVLLAAALAGAALLALEVVWFRVLQLFVVGTSLTFAVMLSVVLSGIGGGGLLAAHWVRKARQPERLAPLCALAAGITTVLGYAGLPLPLRFLGDEFAMAAPTLSLAAWLMLPTSIASGMLFTLLGLRLHVLVGGDARATGLLTLANTVGAMAGALAGGFLLLPRLGSEASVFAIALVYAAVALAAASGAPRAAPSWRALAWGGSLFAAILALFPFGLMQRDLAVRASRRFAHGADRVVAFREGLTETLIYLQRDLLGVPVHHSLITNAVPMSATGFTNERYMKLFAYLPRALQHRTRRALLICYGVGTTARGILEDPALERLDVVDISADVLQLGRVVFAKGEPYPLDDPRTRVHVEDGRFFLLTRGERYDLVTAEPPPPRNAGVVSLYSREYFSLVRDRLAEGGLATHWLPVFDLELSSVRSVVRAFCDVFPDCTLWTGAGFHWILMGSRGATGQVPAEDFLRAWREPGMAAALRAIGLERPRQLGALFLADAEVLREFAGEALPLVDDRPQRLTRRDAGPEGYGHYLRFMDASAARERFARSAWVGERWPEQLRAETLARFAEQDIFNRSRMGTYGLLTRSLFPVLADALTGTDLEVLPLVVAGSEPREQDALDRALARGEGGPLSDYLLALRALARRDYTEADRRFVRLARAEPGFEEVTRFRALALCLAGRGEEARPLITQAVAAANLAPEERPLWAGLISRCPPARRYFAVDQ